MGLVWVAVMDFGATWNQAAVAFASLACAWACALSLLQMRPGWTFRITALQAASGAAFVLTLAWVVFTLTPYGPFSVDQAWRLTGDPGALTIDKGATLIELFKLAGLGAMVFVGMVLASTEKRAERSVNLLLALGGIYALWAILAFLGSGAEVLGVQKTYHLDRLTASFMSANSAGSVFGMLAAVAWISGLRNLQAHVRQSDFELRLSRPLVGAGVRFGLAGLFWAALLFTGSRAAMGATMVCLVLFTALEAVEFVMRRQPTRGKVVAYVLPASLGMAVLFAATVGQRFVGRFSSLGQDRASRETMLGVYLRAAQDAPITGVGLGAFRALNLSLIQPETFLALWSLGAAHNVYLQWVLECGLIGSAMMATAMILLLVDIARRRMAGRSGRTRAGVALAASAVLLIHNAVDYSIQVPAVAMLWALLLGLGAGAASPGQKSDAPSRSQALGVRGSPNRSSSMANRPAGSSTRAAINSIG